MRYKPANEKYPDKLIFFSGGEKYDKFMTCFNQEDLLVKFRENAKQYPLNDITIFGEAYGGNQQGMSHTYGNKTSFIAFEVRVNEQWMGVTAAHKFVEAMGLEFVPYEIVETTEEYLDYIMKKESEVAIRRGVGPGKLREGVVLRPLYEFVAQGENGGPIRVKHKNPEFEERVKAPKVFNPDKHQKMEDAAKIAEEFVVYNRLEHVLSHLIADKVIGEKACIQDAQHVIKAMIEDVEREAANEITTSQDVRRAIGKQTMKVFKQFLGNQP